jgi:hypothetical protein
MKRSRPKREGLAGREGPPADLTSANSSTARGRGVCGGHRVGHRPQPPRSLLLARSPAGGREGGGGKSTGQRGTAAEEGS